MSTFTNRYAGTFILIIKKKGQKILFLIYY